MKPGSNKATAIKVAAKKPMAKKAVVNRATASGKHGPTKVAARKPSRVQKAPAGYKETGSGLIVPEALRTVVSPSKFKKGLVLARETIKESILEFSHFMTQDMEISEIELSISFDAKGEFLGFGVGGAASVKIKIRPCDQPA